MTEHDRLIDALEQEIISELDYETLREQEDRRSAAKKTLSEYIEQRTLTPDEAREALRLMPYASDKMPLVKRLRFLASPETLEK
jgi:hypothetical protein